MARTRSAETLVSTGVFPEAVRSIFENAALKNPVLKASLAQNPGLSSETWWKLYKPSLKKDTVLALVSRSLDTQQRVHVITSDKRSTVLEALLEHNALDLPEQQALLAAPGFTPGIAAKMLSASWCDVALRRTLALTAGGQVQLEWLAGATPSECSDVDAASMLASFPTWGPVLDENKPRGKRSRSAALTALLNRRPSLMKEAVAPGQHEAVVMAAAGVRHLTDESLQIQALGFDPDLPYPVLDIAQVKYKLMALVNNPAATPRVVDAVLAFCDSEQGRNSWATLDLKDSTQSRKAKHPEALHVPYDAVSNPDDLQWLAKRCLPSDYKPDGRPFDILALAKNPHLPEQMVHRVKRALESPLLISSGELHQAEVVMAQNYPDICSEQKEGCSTSPDGYQYQETPVSDYSTTQLNTVNCWALEQPHVAQRVPVALSAALGVSITAWESFFSLVAEFDGTVGDLADLCVRL